VYVIIACCESKKYKLNKNPNATWNKGWKSDKIDKAIFHDFMQNIINSFIIFVCVYIYAIFYYMEILKSAFKMV